MTCGAVLGDVVMIDGQLNEEQQIYLEAAVDRFFCPGIIEEGYDCTAEDYADSLCFEWRRYLDGEGIEQRRVNYDFNQEEFLLKPGQIIVRNRRFRYVIVTTPNVFINFAHNTKTGLLNSGGA